MAAAPGKVTFVVASLAALLVAVGACLSTSGLTDGEAPLEDAGRLPDVTALPPNPCGADLQHDVGNCGTCGHVCPFGANSFPTCTAGACTIGCNSLFGDCDTNQANGCETPLASDKNNCNACGRTCAGADCANGQCQPVVIVPTAGGQATGIAADGTHVFFAYNNATQLTSGIVRVDPDGGNPLVLVQGQKLTIFSVAVDGSFVYWIATATNLDAAPNGAVMKVPKEGGAVTVVSSLQPTASVSSLTITASFAYWTNYGVSDAMGTYLGGTIAQCALPAGCDARPTLLASGLTRPYGLALDATTLYVGVAGTGTGGEVYRCPLTGCAPAPTPVQPAITPYSIALDATNAYWVTDTAVVKADRARGDAVPLAVAQRQPRGLVVDGGKVYWTNYAGGTVAMCGVDGCNATPTSIATNQTNPFGLAVDATSLYWTTYAGTVTRLIK